MSSDIWFPVAGLFISIFTIFLYIKKVNVKTKETRLYFGLIIINFFGLILELLCTYASFIRFDNPFLSNLILKAYLDYNLVYCGLLLYYTFIVSHQNIKEKTFKKIINPGLVIFLVISAILIHTMDMSLVVSEDFRIRYTTGPSVIFTFSVCGLILGAILVFVLLDIKNIRNKKYIPILSFLIIGFIGIVIQTLQPGILILTFIETFVNLIMFHTIENPDVKMIEALRVAKESAEKANQAKSDFLSAMSHEIRTPLNAIVGFSESLKEESLTPSQLEEVNDIIDASNTLLETVNGILDISKIEANKIEIINETYSTEKLFKELVKLSEARLGNEKPIEFKYHLAEDTPKYLYGDHVRIKQVILNFLTNAIKYTKKGYIEFDVRNICRGNTCRLIIKVEDSGIGIKKESIDRLFDKFDRLDNENSTIEGTGLGLAITKRLVELMHGKIIVQSIYGKGSQFTIVIDQRIVNDAIAQEVEEVKEESTTINNDLSSKKVLIVDDNLMNLKVAARLLKSYNVIIEQADSGFKCLDLIGAGNKYDLILLDDMMPKMSGKETFKKLKEDSSFNTPVVILTANAITGMKEEYLQFGFNDYLAKPIEKDELNRVIKKFLDK